MPDFPLSDISALSPSAQKVLLGLNNAYQEETSYLSMSDWQNLIELAFCAICINKAAFLIAFDQNAKYANPNFQWFRERYDRFVYIDRIVVSKAFLGAGQVLYSHLFSKALGDGHQRVTCEININPPNPRSDAFHQRMGFQEIGKARLSDRQKTVRYLLRNIDAEIP